MEKSRPYYDHVFLKEDCLLPNGQFDLVVLNGVIEHICDVNLQILFSDIIRKLLPNGAIFVTVPNNFSPQILLQRLTKTIRPDLEVGHVNLKTKSEWKEFFRGFGFRNFKFSYFLALKHSNHLNYFKSRFANYILRKTVNLCLFPIFYHLRNSFYITAKR